MGNPHFTGPPKAKQVKQDVTVISAALHYIAHSLFKDGKTHGKREIEIKTGWGGFPTKPFLLITNIIVVNWVNIHKGKCTKHEPNHGFKHFFFFVLQCFPLLNTVK